MTRFGGSFLFFYLCVYFSWGTHENSGTLIKVK
jgi:hypothetical protein